jgi:hypothetical protein
MNHAYLALDLSLCVALERLLLIEVDGFAKDALLARGYPLQGDN